MIKREIKMKKTILTVMLVITFFTGQIFAFVYANHACKANDACGGEGKKSSGSNMGQMIIEGAGHFLMSHSEMLKFLNKIELSELTGPDYSELQDIINRAIESMENASETYKNLISIAKETPYNMDVISKLRIFDYAGYMKTNGLNRVIFKKVKYFLRKGDVIGVYIYLKSDMDSIIEQLVNIKSNVDSEVFPEISLLWRINQKYSESLLFGQYVAEVFKNL
jgi:hypothetical protein